MRSTCLLLALLAPPILVSHDVCADPASLPCLEITKNGFVYQNAQYPYLGHGYYYDFTPGDNDMPWLRDFANSKEIFSDVNMSLDWKDREFDMMKAIIWYTSNNMVFTGVSEFTEGNRRARAILEYNEEHPGCEWGCGDIAYAAIGLAQAHGIPARAFNGRDEVEPWGGDYCVEMYSTRYNRWVFLFEHCYSWIEHEIDGPLGARELRAYDVQQPIECVWNTDLFRWEAVPYPPLVFMPSIAQSNPNPPFANVRWNATRWKHFMYTAITMPNRAVELPLSTQYLCNDPWYGTPSECNPSAPVVFIEDLNANYPLNNIEASLVSIRDGYQVLLKNNMFDFARYEGKEGSAPWAPLLVSSCGPGLASYIWQPGPTPATLTIRGVSVAGVHSPDVTVLLRERFMPGDLDSNGFTDGRDIQSFVSYIVTGVLPEGVLSCSADFNANGRFDNGDIRHFVDLLVDKLCSSSGLPPPGGH